MFSTDIYKKFLHRGATDREMVRVGRTASFVALCICGMIFRPSSASWRRFQVLPKRIDVYRLSFMATVLMGILLKRVNYAAGNARLVGDFLSK